MAGEKTTSERIAQLEVHVQNLNDRVTEVRASLQETTKEFREAIERHRDHHSDEAAQSSNSRWRLVSAVLGILAVVGPIATFVATKVWG